MGRDVSCFADIFTPTYSRLQRVGEAYVSHCQNLVVRYVVAVSAARVPVVLWADAMDTQEVAHQLCGFQGEQTTFQPSFQCFLPRFFLPSERACPWYEVVCVLLAKRPGMKVCHDDCRGATVFSNGVSR